MLKELNESETQRQINEQNTDIIKIRQQKNKIKNNRMKIIANMTSSYKGKL